MKSHTLLEKTIEPSSAARTVEYFQARKIRRKKSNGQLLGMSWLGIKKKNITNIQDYIICSAVSLIA